MRIDEARIEQAILSKLMEQDGGIETKELLKINEDKEEILAALQRLKSDGRIDSRRLGKEEYWYALTFAEPKRILIVEDDKNIAKLISLALGESYEKMEVYDGDAVMPAVESFKPDLIILDLMLPGKNGIEICKEIKQNATTRGIKIVILSAADAAINRFFGIKYGADYYIKKPFEPDELRALVNIFLRKHGTPFDPLVDLPNAEQLVQKLKEYVKEPNGLSFYKVEIEGFADYQCCYKPKDARALLRVISQMLQDKAKEIDGEVFLAYLGEDSFLFVAQKEAAERALKEAELEFRRVSSFIRQRHKIIGDLFIKLRAGKSGEGFGLGLAWYQINFDVFKRQFEKKEWPDFDTAVAANVAAIRKYTIDEIRTLFDSTKIEATIKAIGDDIRITAGKVTKKK